MVQTLALGARLGWWPMLRICITNGNLRLAALLFDWIIPVRRVEEVPTRPLNNDQTLEEFLQEGLIDQPRDFIETVVPMAPKQIFPQLSATEPHYQCGRGTFYCGDQRWAMHGSTPIGVFPEYARFKKSYFGFPTTEFTENATNRDPLIKIGSIPIVSNEDLTWELVREFRKDDEARKKLRRLRRFAFEDYRDRPITYIEDDLMTRIEDHQDAAKKWALTTLQSAFSISSTDKVLAALAGGFIAAVAGAPVSIAAATGATAILGTSLVQIRTTRKLFEMDQSHDPVRYLVEVIDAQKKQ